MPTWGGSLQQPEEEGPFGAWHMAGQREAIPGSLGSCIQNEEAALVMWQGGTPNSGCPGARCRLRASMAPLPGRVRQLQCGRHGATVQPVSSPRDGGIVVAMGPKLLGRSGDEGQAGERKEADELCGWGGSQASWAPPGTHHLFS